MGLVITFIISGLVFIFIGLSVHVFKWYFLISGYNTMSKEKKANVDVEGLGRLMGIYGYVNGVLFILLGLLYYSGFKEALNPALVFFGISTVFLLIKAQKYDGNVFEDGKIKEGAWKQFLIPAGIVLVTLIFVVVLIFFSMKPAKVTFQEEGIQIHGMYGGVYTWESIKKVELEEGLPTIEMRTNGSAIGSNLKGHFRTKELGSVKLFVNTEKPPFIYLEIVDEKPMFLNLENRNETERVFREIIEARE